MDKSNENLMNALVDCGAVTPLQRRLMDALPAFCTDADPELFDLLALLLCLAAGWAASARDVVDTVAVQRLSGQLLAYRAEQGDTLFYDYLPPVWVFPRHARQKSADMRKYYRLVYNFNKVYPYALAARHLSHMHPWPAK